MTYLALLRGINVGGNNIIKMEDLRECFEQTRRIAKQERVPGGMKFENVRTYIQSGNVLFDTPKTKSEMLEANIEKALKKRFDYDGIVVVISDKELESIVDEAPKGFGAKPEKYRYDVLFLKRPMKASAAAKEITLNENVDKMHVGKHAIYFSRLADKASTSRLSKLASQPIYQHITIRNWNTTTKLLAMTKDG